MAYDSGFKHFRYWCQKVLPQVYDDSLSYYELLNRVVAILNAALDEIQNLGENVDSLKQVIADMKTYMENYFTNLNVQNEINNKLDSMAADGTLDKIINQHIFGEIQDKITELQTGLNTTNTNLTNGLNTAQNNLTNGLNTAQNNLTSAVNTINKEFKDRTMWDQTYSNEAGFGLFFNVEPGANYGKSTIWQTGDGIAFYPVFNLAPVGRNTVIGYYDKTAVFLRLDYSDIEGTGKGLRIGQSRNLTDWQIQNVNPGIPVPTNSPSKHLWSNPGSFFNYNGNLYCCFCCNTNVTNMTTDAGQSFDTYVIQIKDAYLGTVIFETPQKIPALAGSYFIDPYIYVNEKYNISKIFYKKDKTPWAIYCGDINLDTLAISNVIELTNLANNYEAPSAYYTGLKWNVYVDCTTPLIGEGGGMMVSSGRTLQTLSKPQACARNGMNMRAGGVVRFKDMPHSLDILSQFTKVNKQRFVQISGPGITKTLNMNPGPNTNYFTNGNVALTSIADAGGTTDHAVIVTGINGLTVFTNGALTGAPNAYCYADSDKAVELVRVNDTDWHIIGQETKTVQHVTPTGSAQFLIFGQIQDPIICDVSIILNNAAFYSIGKVLIMGTNANYVVIKENKQTEANIRIQLANHTFGTVAAKRLIVTTGVPYASIAVRVYGLNSIGFFSDNAT